MTSVSASQSQYWNDKSRLSIMQRTETTKIATGEIQRGHEQGSSEEKTHKTQHHEATRCGGLTDRNSE